MTNYPNARVGDRIKVSDRYGALGPGEWAKPGCEFTVTGVTAKSYTADLNDLLITAVTDDGRRISGFGTDWFDLVKRAEPKVGDRVRVTGALYLEEYLPFTGTVTKVDLPDTLSGKAHPYMVKPDPSQGSGTEGAYAYDVEIIESAATTEATDPLPARPTIDFSTPSRETAREYARSLNSRVLKPENQRILDAVGRGEQVDAYDLNKAVMEALSSCATRAGQSMARRDMTKKGRHLAYIVQGVLENHADGLPVYADGERSRKMEDLKQAVASAREEIDRQVAENEALKLQHSKAIFEQQEDLTALQEQYDVLLKVAESRDEILAETVRERDTLAETLDYILSNLVEDVDKARILGFKDGYAAR